MTKIINIPSQIVVQTSAQWAVDVTVYSAKRILVASDLMYGTTDQRKFKVADGTQTWPQLDYFPVSGFDDATSSIQTQINAAINAANLAQADIDAHELDTNNPHSVTKSQVGLSNVDNTSDANKPVSTAQAAADAVVLASAESYADSIIVSDVNDRGGYDASTNLFPSTGGRGTLGVPKKGDQWEISIAGTLGTKSVDVGDLVRALIDTPGQTPSNWYISSYNTQQATETARGTAKVATQAIVEDNTTSNDTAFVSAKKFWFGFAKGLTLSGTISAVVAMITTTTQGALINGATDKATPVDADYVGLMDSAASNILKKLSWANIKATLKSYFDGIYDPIANQANISASAIDWNVTHSYKTLGANTTFTFSNAANAKTIIVAITNTASNYTVTWPIGVDWGSSGAPTQRTGANTDIYTFVQINGTIYGSVRQ